MLWPDDADLLEDLACVLTTGDSFPPEPPEHHLDIFRAAVALHCEPAASPQSRPAVISQRRRAGRHTARVGAMAASLVLVAASAAAASITSDGLPLPRPVRAVADVIGLPVDSIALHDAHQHLQQLQEAVHSKDHRRVEVAIRNLRRDVLHLDDDERREAQPAIETALHDATTSLHDPAEPTGSPREPAPVVNSSVPPDPAPSATGSGGWTTRPRPDRSTVVGTPTTSPSDEGPAPPVESPEPFTADTAASSRSDSPGSDTPSISEDRPTTESPISEPVATSSDTETPDTALTMGDADREYESGSDTALP